MVKKIDLSHHSFLEEMKGLVAEWNAKNIPTSLKFEGLIRSFLQTMDAKYFLATINESGSSCKMNISGSLEQRYVNRPDATPVKIISKEQDEFLEQIYEKRLFWAEQLHKNNTAEHCLNGLILSIIATLIGLNPSPKYLVVENSELRNLN